MVKHVKNSSGLPRRTMHHEGQKKKVEKLRNDHPEKIFVSVGTLLQLLQNTDKNAKAAMRCHGIQQICFRYNHCVIQSLFMFVLSILPKRSKISLCVTLQSNLSKHRLNVLNAAYNGAD